MKLNLRIAQTLALAAATSLALSGTPRPVQADTPRTPVLVELFTSEGCSSCPPADTLLSELVHMQPVPGALVIALGEHVDYWDGRSWTDPFSSHALTVRQNDYASSFHNRTVYTPQMVVDGRTEFVGSDSDKAESVIARAARAPKAQVSVTPDPQAGSYAVSVRGLPTLAPGDTAEVFFAVTQDGLRSQVRGGENSGRTLTHVAVVRLLERLGTAKAGETFSVRHQAAGAGRSGSHVLVFVQARSSRRVLGAAVAARG